MHDSVAGASLLCSSKRKKAREDGAERVRTQSEEMKSERLPGAGSYRFL